MRKHHGTGNLYSLMQQACTPDTYCNKHFGSIFGYLTERAPNAQFTDSQLKDLVARMNDGADVEDTNNVPVGFAFLGQFIDHDITLDATSQLGKAFGDPNKIKNLRTPRLDLDSVYLDGPEGSPYLYKDERLVIGAYNELDLQRNIRGTAIIGDPRNDENIFISQLHGLFIRFHNYLMDHFQVTDEKKRFEEVRQEVRWTYQYIVVNEFLPAIISSGVLDDYINGFNNKILPVEHGVDWSTIPVVPVEFSVAAYRFGHSHIRQNYRVNDHKAARLFQAGGFAPLPESLNIDWKYFFDIDGTSYFKAQRIDTKMAMDLFNLPFVGKEGRANDEHNLALRNLRRGEVTFGLLTGEEVSLRLFNQAPIPTHPDVVQLGLAGTPLWFYVLAEAERLNGKLGTVGGKIVAGTILQMLLNDKDSYINMQPNFVPSIDAVQSSYMSGIAEVVNLVYA